MSSEKLTSVYVVRYWIDYEQRFAGAFSSREKAHEGLRIMGLFDDGQWEVFRLPVDAVVIYGEIAPAL